MLFRHAIHCSNGQLRLPPSEMFISSRFRSFAGGFRSFAGGFSSFQLVSGGFSSFQVVLTFINYEV